MRKSLYLRNFRSQSSQQGYALFIVLMIMIVIALLVVTAVQSYNTEQRISTNEADRKLTLSLAEAALQKGEDKILEFDGKKVVFKAKCIGTIGGAETKGLCATPDAVVPDEIRNAIDVEKIKDNAWKVNAWERGEGKKLYIDENGESVIDIKTENVSKPPVYIIEYISTDASQGSIIYRVTAKAWGKNNNTVVMLQSYVSNE
ncbi:pilus assembly PilX family protein [Neisseria iguanae]|uniref:Pilus assembly protein PilX n=1 Tax=Neisseria iguanae TaxID=90242 RepID=A0A2P7TXT8_9NEIS|nr:pilus assembly protein [Neisseria iguanae]PSJ79538.1 pilus assembly protein PilX [Neisseria iguanae]